MTTAYSRIRGSMGNGYANNAGLVEDASTIVGIDPALMKAIGMAESKFIVNAKNPYGSASGLFQFTDDTWRGSMAQHAKALGIPANAHQFDPKANALLTAQAIKGYQDNIVKNGRKITATDVYANHFLGTGGYSKFAKVLNTNPNAPVSTVLSPKAIKDNKIYTLNKDGSLKTVAEMYDALSAKLGEVGPTSYAPRPSQVNQQVAEQNLKTKLAEEYLLSGYRQAWENLHNGQNTPFNPYESNPLMKYLSTPEQPQQEQPKEIFNASQVAEDNLKKYGLNPTTARNREDFERSLGIKNYTVNGGGIDPASLNRVAQLAVNAKQASIDHIRNTDKLAQAQFGYGQVKDKMETELGIAKLLAGASSGGTGSGKGGGKSSSNIDNQLTIQEQLDVTKANEISNPNLELVTKEEFINKWKTIGDTGLYEFKDGKLTAKPGSWFSNSDDYMMEQLPDLVNMLTSKPLAKINGKEYYFDDILEKLSPREQTTLFNKLDKLMGERAVMLGDYRDTYYKDGKKVDSVKHFEDLIAPLILEYVNTIGKATEISIRKGTTVGDNKFGTNRF